MPDPKIDPNLPRVILTFTGKGIMLEYKNANWEVAVNMLVDGLQIARGEEVKERVKKEQERIVTGDPSQIPNLRV